MLKKYNLKLITALTDAGMIYRDNAPKLKLFLLFYK